MTIEEIRKNFACTRDGYISCQDCPVAKEHNFIKRCDGRHNTGYEDCWKTIQEYLKENMPVDEVEKILCDINPAEIAAQIQNDNLSHWCEVIREEIMKKVSEKYEPRRN